MNLIYYDATFIIIIFKLFREIEGQCSFPYTNLIFQDHIQAAFVCTTFTRCEHHSLLHIECQMKIELSKRTQPQCAHAPEIEFLRIILIVRDSLFDNKRIQNVREHSNDLFRISLCQNSRNYLLLELYIRRKPFIQVQVKCVYRRTFCANVTVCDLRLQSGRKRVIYNL